MKEKRSGGLLMCRMMFIENNNYSYQRMLNPQQLDDFVLKITMRLVTKLFSADAPVYLCKAPLQTSFVEKIASQPSEAHAYLQKYFTIKTHDRERVPQVGRLSNVYSCRTFY